MGLAEIQKIKDQALLPKVKKVYTISKKSAKKIQQEKNQTTVIVKPKKPGWFDADKAASEDIVNVKSDLQQWFEERRLEMKGYCCECGKKSFKDNDKQFKWSLAHILKKSIFHSISTHPSNYLELCWLHHQEFDSSYSNAQKMNCWSLAKEKFEIMKSSITEKHKDLVWFE